MPEPPRDVLVFEPFRLEADGRLLRGDEPVPLAPKELALLRLLAGARGRVVPKTEILDRVWPGDPVSDTSLTRCVYGLRTALGDRGRAGGLIETLNGRGYRFRAPVRSEPLERPRRELRVAVIPFDLAGERGQEYVAEGIAADVTARLGRIREAGVAPVARHSAQRLRQAGADPIARARKLALDVVVTGRLRVKGGALDAVVEAVRVRDEVLLWSQEFSCAEEAAQELAVEIAEALATRLAGSAPDVAHSPSATADPRAYRAVLQGEFVSQLRTERGLRQGIRSFEQALAWDPRSADAHAALALAHVVLGMRGYEPPLESAALARAGIARALELDDENVSALGSLAYLRWAIDWKPDAAIALMVRARRLAPHDDRVAYWHALFLGSVGRFDEAFGELQRAIALNPLSIAAPALVAEVLSYAGRFEEARTTAQRLAELEPEYAIPRAIHACAAGVLGLAEEAVRAAEAADRLARGDHPVRSACGWAFAVAGRETAARAILASLERAVARRYVGATFPAAIHAGLGDRAAALACLERAVRERCGWLPRIGFDPRFAALRDDPRFREIAALANGGAPLPATTG